MVHCNVVRLDGRRFMVEERREMTSIKNLYTLFRRRRTLLKGVEVTSDCLREEKTSWLTIVYLGEVSNR